MNGPGKCDVVNNPFVNSAIARGLVVRVASIASSGGAAATTALRTSVSDSNVDQQLLAQDTGRLGWALYNESSAILYLAIGTGTSSLTSYTLQVAPGGYYEAPVLGAYQQSEVRGIWASDTANGAARITQFRP
jgi:hypothetical protein